MDVMWYKWTATCWLKRVESEFIFKRADSSPVFDEGAEFRTETLRLRQERRIIADNAGQYLEIRLAVAVRWIARGQFHQRDAQRPNIRSDIVIRMRRIWWLDSLRLGEKPKNSIIKTFF